MYERQSLQKPYKQPQWTMDMNKTINEVFGVNHNHLVAQIQEYENGRMAQMRSMTNLNQADFKDDLVD